MFVHSSAAFLTQPAADKKILETILKQYTPLQFRRINKFILLALIGVYKCLCGNKVATDAGVYLTTENGNVADTETILTQIYRSRAFPMPYAFINTMSNTASFYIAQRLNITGRNITISSRYLSYERGLEFLKIDFKTGNVKQALIGGVDEAILFDARYSNMPKTDKERLVDASAWLYLKNEKHGAIGEIVDIKNFKTLEHALKQLQHKLTSEYPDNQIVFSFGKGIDNKEKIFWKNNINFKQEFDYIKEYGISDSITACGIALFFEQSKNEYLVHINKNMKGNYAVLLIRKYIES